MPPSIGGASGVVSKLLTLSADRDPSLPLSVQALNADLLATTGLCADQLTLPSESSLIGRS